MTIPKVSIIEQEENWENIPVHSLKESLELSRKERIEAEQRADEAEQWLKEVKAWCKKVDSFKESLIATYGEETINKIIKESNNLNN